MLESKAWNKLSAQQIKLYIYCRLQVYGEKKKPLLPNGTTCSNQDLLFTMNQGKWSTIYNIYKKSNAKGFQRDITKLIELGFVECLMGGAITRKKSIYYISDLWQKYGTDDFNVPATKKTVAMNRKARQLKNNSVTTNDSSTDNSTTTNDNSVDNSIVDSLEIEDLNTLESNSNKVSDMVNIYNAIDITQQPTKKNYYNGYGDNATRTLIPYPPLEDLSQ